MLGLFFSCDEFDEFSILSCDYPTGFIYFRSAPPLAAPVCHVMMCFGWKIVRDLKLETLFEGRVTTGCGGNRD